MKTVGEILRSAREQLHLTSIQVASQTKIQEKFIQALENNAFDQLPESAFVKGFIRNYAKVVRKDPEMLLAIFRRDYGEDAKGRVVPRGLTNPLNQPRLRWTPQATVIASATLVITVFTTYLLLQFRLLSGVPSLTVNSPVENATVSALVTVEGVTHPQTTVTVNSKPVEVKENGEFSDTIGLTSGTRTITIEARSRSGKTKTLQRTVVVE